MKEIRLCAFADEASASLEGQIKALNKNAIPYDPLPPSTTSGIRLGTPAGTTRGFKEKEFEIIGNAIADVVDAMNTPNLDKVLIEVKERIEKLTKAHPIY